MLQEVAYLGGEAAGNAMGGGGIVGGYQPGKVGNLHERFASALGLAVEVVEEGGFCCVGKEVGICPGFDVLMHFFASAQESLLLVMTRVRMLSGSSPLFAYCSR